VISPLLYRDKKLFFPRSSDIFRSSVWRHDGAYSGGVVVICFCETGLAAVIAGIAGARLTGCAGVAG
jgi:hypothetical protein